MSDYPRNAQARSYGRGREWDPGFRLSDAPCRPGR